MADSLAPTILRRRPRCDTIDEDMCLKDEPTRPTSLESLPNPLLKLMSEAKLDHGCLNVAAPMVRYSKLPFRMLVREWGADLALTPMLIATSFNRSELARNSDFITCKEDRPLVVQFAANDPIELARAALKVRGLCEGVNLNCGCPQAWTMKEGLGCALIRQPNLVKEMVRKTKEYAELPCTIKIRIRKDLRDTVDLVHKAEKAGVTWVTVHGRGPHDKKLPVNLEAIKTVKQQATVPVLANGDIFTPADVKRTIEETGADGVMCARGLLANPALFDDYEETPLACAYDYLNLATQFGGALCLHLHHFQTMFTSQLGRSDRVALGRARSMAAVLDFFEERRWEFEGTPRRTGILTSSHYQSQHQEGFRVVPPTAV